MSKAHPRRRPQRVWKDTAPSGADLRVEVCEDESVCIAWGLMGRADPEHPDRQLADEFEVAIVTSTDIPEPPPPTAAGGKEQRRRQALRELAATCQPEPTDELADDWLALSRLAARAASELKGFV